MTRRNIPFGYAIHDGSYVIDAEEAKTVQYIFGLYTEGHSYAAIAEEIIARGIPYDRRAPQWNKHKVKRILENRRYLGIANFPAIIPGELFEQVQCIHESRKTTPVRTQKTARDLIWSRIHCENCGGWCVRFGGAYKDKDRDVLVCKQCGMAVQIRKSEIEEAILAQFNAHEYSQSPSYQISKEVMRLNHQINRSLENPEDPGEIVGYILQGITARCACCSDVDVRHKSRLTEVNPEHFGQVVSAIQLSADGTVALEFK